MTKSCALLSILILAAAAGAGEAERPRLVVQAGHAGIITSAELSPDGTRLLSADGTGAVILWDAASGRELRQFVVEGSGAEASFIPGGSDILVRPYLREPRIFDARSGEAQDWFAPAGTTVLALAVSPDGRRLLAGTRDGRLSLWDRVTRERVWERQLVDGEAPLPVAAVTFRPGGREVIYGTQAWHSSVVICDAGTGEERRRLAGPFGTPLVGVTASPDGGRILTRDGDFYALWDADSGAEICRAPSSMARSAGFSPDGRYLFLTAVERFPRPGRGTDAGVSVLSAADGRPVLRVEPAAASPYEHIVSVVCAACFDPDGETILTAGVLEPIRRHRLSDGRVIEDLGAGSAAWSVLARIPGGQGILAGGSGGVYLHDPVRSTTVPFVPAAFPVASVAVSGDGRRLVAAALRDSPGASGRRFDGAKGAVDDLPEAVAVEMDGPGRRLFVSRPDGTVRLLDASTLAEIRAFPPVTDLAAFDVSANGERLAVLYREGARVWDVATGVTVRDLPGAARFVRLSADGGRVLVGSASGAAVVHALGGEAGPVELAAEDLFADTTNLPGGRRFTQPHLACSGDFSRDGRRVVTASPLYFRTWDAESGAPLLAGRTSSPCVVSTFTPDGSRLVLGASDGPVEVRGAEDGKLVVRLEGHRGMVSGVSFIDDGRLAVTGSWDASVRIWDLAAGEERVRIHLLRDGGFAALDPAGRYDASDAGDVAGLHWVVGDEPIGLDQLKERYYEPGLLGKVLGWNPEPRREVGAFEAPKLYPGLTADAPAAGSTRIDLKLTNRGGGIGRVVVRVNGKERTADARGPDLDPDAAEATIPLDLAGDPRLKPGEPNDVEVLVYNAEGYLRSRGLRLAVTPPGEKAADPPRLWAVVAGIADYRGQAIDLKYAAKDARDFAAALRLAADGLFGADRTRVRLLTDGEATRENLLAALAETRAAAPGDVLVVYLAGHGVNQGGQAGDFHYLTAAAASADLSDPAVRAAVALSSAEIADRIREIPAGKQVLVLDTCASGRLVEKLTEKREVPSSQVRAMQRVKDRTGMYVLAGCAADSVSYEATPYAQGILTWSLLLGMRGAALREDAFVDVATLFAFAADRVPELARDVGGIQRPVVAAPRAGGSFDLGRLTPEARGRIPLAEPRPIFLRSTFQDEEEFRDVRGLGALVDEALRGAAAGSDAPIVFVDAADLPGALSLAGRYRTEGAEVVVEARLFRGKERLAVLEARGPDLPALAARIAEEARARVR